MMNTQKIADMLNVHVNNVALVGSKFICDGKGNDWDFLVLATEEIVDRKGFKSDLNDELYPSKFRSFRKGDINLIVTNDHGFFRSEYAIACAAKILFDLKRCKAPIPDMNTRDGRVAFHGFVRDLVADRIEDVPF
jgi:hypothetical protein